MKRFILPALAAIVLSCAPRVKDADSEYAKDLIKPGEAIPEFSIPAAQDSTVCTKADVAGAYLVLDFWATWCPDCRADVPAMKELYAEFGDKVRFVGISFDTDKEAFDKYLAENEIAWLQLSDFAGKKESSIGEDFHVKWIPSMYLVDPDGNVVLGTVMVDKLRAALEKL
jgi:thiol-disulfide isomerase/thioredoxin